MGLQVWLPLNGNLNNLGLADVSLGNNGATVDNSGKIGKCYSFNGVNNYIVINNFDMSELAEYSISCWVKPNGNDISFLFLVRGGGTHQIRISYDGFMFRDTKNSSQRTVAFGEGFTDGQWTHICCVYIRGEIYLYQNGIQTAHSDTYYHADGQTNLNNTEIRIGLVQSSTGYSYFSGCVNDFRIYDTALSPREVKEISKGLVLHYPLSMPGQENLQQGSDCIGSANVPGWVDNGNTTLEKIGDVIHFKRTLSNAKTVPTIVMNCVTPCEFNKSYVYSMDLKFDRDIITTTAAPAHFWYGARNTDDIFNRNCNGNLSKRSSTVLSPPASTIIPANTWFTQKYRFTFGDGPTSEGYDYPAIRCFVYGSVLAENYTGEVNGWMKNCKIEEGEIATPWIPNPADAEYSAIGLDEDIIYDTSGFQNNGELFVLGKNLIDKNSVSVSGYINSSGGITGTSGWNYTDYIKVKPDTSYIASSISVGGSGTYFALYDAGKTLTRTVLIIASQNPTFTTTANEKYVRFSIRSLKNELDTAKLEVGTAATAYDSEGSIEWETNSPRYILACNPHSANSTQNNKQGTTYIRGDCELITPNQLTIAFWCYARPQGYGGNNCQGLFCTTNINYGDGLGSDYTSSAMNHRDDKVDINGLSDSKKLSIPIISNVWHHYAFTYDGQNSKSYRDGVLQDTQTLSSVTQLMSFKHILLGFSKAGGVWRRNNNTYSDLRVYTTALSADDILELYHTPETLSHNGTLLTQGELVES